MTDFNPTDLDFVWFLLVSTGYYKKEKLVDHIEIAMGGVLRDCMFRFKLSKDDLHKYANQYLVSRKHADINFKNLIKNFINSL